MALLPCDAASEPAAAGAGLTGGVLGPFQKRTRRAKRRPATRAANSAQSWRRMAAAFFLCSGGSGVQRGGGVSAAVVQRGVGRGGGVQQCNQQCGQALQQSNSEPMAARLRS